MVSPAIIIYDPDCSSDVDKRGTLLFIVIDDRNDTPLETNFIELDFS
jgi:hypothetical protein